eukprot:UN4108
MQNMKEGHYRQIQFFEKRTADDGERMRRLRDELVATKADLFRRLAASSLSPNGEGGEWFGFYDHSDFHPDHDEDSYDCVPTVADSHGCDLPPAAIVAAVVPLPCGPVAADVDTVMADTRRYILLEELDESSARVRDLKQLLAKHLPQSNISEDALRQAMLEVVVLLPWPCPPRFPSRKCPLRHACELLMASSIFQPCMSCSRPPSVKELPRSSSGKCGMLYV